MLETITTYDVIVLGGGAAGLMAASRAGQRGKRVLLLEHGREVGAKILISGGGRCNFTNLNTAPDRFISANPHFCKSALKGFSQHDFIALVTRHKIPYHEKTLGQLFCDTSARAIIDMLLTECRAGKVDIRTGQNITEVTKADNFSAHTQDTIYNAPALILATGGLSIPKLGASDFAHKMAQQFGLEVIAPTPGLVPLTFSGATLALMQPLAGISLEVVARIGKTSFREAMVFTHRGLSGPAILQISSYWHEPQPITLDLLPDADVDSLLQHKRTRPKAALKTALASLLPQRLAQAWLEQGVGNPPLAACSDQKLHAIMQELKCWTLYPTGTEGFAKAEVTVGGIDTRALSSKTMMANAVPGLYIVGEALDVTGWLGGYNFQWAWSSGWAAGSSV